MSARIWTSYLGNKQVLWDAGLVVVDIARFNRFHSDIQLKYKDLAPYPHMLKMPMNEYIPVYNRILERLDPQKVYDELLALGEGKDVVICCHEKDPTNCHRRLAAKWLEDALGIRVPEFKG